MKNLIFTIGTTFIVLLNMAHAGNADPKKQHSTKYYSIDETMVMNPASVLSASSKSIFKIIEQDNQITERKWTEKELVAAKKTIEQIISENNQIIESTILNEIYALDLNN